MRSYLAENGIDTYVTDATDPWAATINNKKARLSNDEFISAGDVLVFWEKIDGGWKFALKKVGIAGSEGYAEYVSMGRGHAQDLNISVFRFVEAPARKKQPVEELPLP